MSINKVILSGNVGKDPEIKHFEGGSKVASFSLATSDSYKNKKGEWVNTSEWHQIKTFFAANFVEKHVRKGLPLEVEGKLVTESWDDQNGQKRYKTVIIADRVRFAAGYKKDPNTTSAPTQTNAPAASSGSVNEEFPGGGIGAEEDDLPF